MKTLLTAIAALGCMSFATPVLAQEATAPPPSNSSTPATTVPAGDPAANGTPMSNAPAGDPAANSAPTGNAPAAAPTGGALPMCGPGVTDRCQQSNYAQRALASSVYKGGGTDAEATGAGAHKGRLYKKTRKHRR